MSVLKWVVSVAAMLMLVACGGGGGSAGTPPFPDPDPVPDPVTGVASLAVVLSPGTIPNTGTGSVTATITALDANRNAVPGAAVTVSAAAPVIAAIQGSSGSVTNASGQLLVTLTVPPNSTNGNVLITARANGAPDASATLQIVDSASGAVPASVEIISAATAVGTGGDTVQLTAFVKDANNNALPGTTVAFSASTGTLSSVSTSTNAAGAATATLSAGANRSNRNATVRVTAGAVSGSLTLPITGTTLKVSGPSSLVFGASASFDVVVTDSKSNVLANVPVTATSALGNALAATSTTTTDANGQISFRYTASVAGTDTLTFDGGGASVSPPSVTISGQDFAFISPAASSTVNVGVSQTVTIRLRNAGVPLVGQAVSFAATGGTVSPTSAVTDSTGQASVTLRSLSAGPVTVQASAVVNGGAVSATLPLNIVATTPATLVLQVNPTAVAPTTGTAQVIAKVTDESGNPVAGTAVNFTRVADPSGGNLQQASATTDSNGQASVTYRAGAQSTADKGVVLKAEVASNASVSSTATLTVNQTSLFIALGTGNEITNADPQTYQKDWTTYVTDSNSIPLSGVTLTIKSIPSAYRTGVLDFDDNENLWVYKSPIYECRNEDRNLDGKLRGRSTATVTAVTTGTTTRVTAPGHQVQAGDVVTIAISGTSPTTLAGTFVASSVDATSFTVPVNTSGNAAYTPADVSFIGFGEDDNGDGVLWPGNVIAVSPGSVQTVAGRATLSLTYAESYALWVAVRLTASATVTGTESSTFVDFLAPFAAPDYNDKGTEPAGAVSPYGRAPLPGAVCTPVTLQ